MPTGARGIGYPRVGIRGGCELTWVLGPLLQAHEDGCIYIYIFNGEILLLYGEELMARIVSHLGIIFPLLGHSLRCKSHSPDSFLRANRWLFLLYSQSCVDATTVTFRTFSSPQEETLYPWGSPSVFLTCAAVDSTSCFSCCRFIQSWYFMEVKSCNVLAFVIDCFC